MALVLLGLLAPACAAAPGRQDEVATAPTTATTAPSAPVAATTAPLPPVTVPPTIPPTAATTKPAAPRRVAPDPTPAPPPRVVFEVAWAPFATVGGVTLASPAARVERFAFHESNHDGARTLEPLATSAATMTLETRERGTAARSAADVVADPDGEIRAPVTGIVKRAGTYVLYCKYSDDYAVIEPDAHPGWEVKLLHIDGVKVTRGQRVTAGETVMAPRPTKLPFESQVDEVTADPPWPHVHLEVVDPSIPDRPSPGGGCS